MKIITFFCVIIAGLSQATDENERLFAKKYLEKYQYVNHAKTLASNGDVMSTAIMDMQVYAGLQPTGKLDQPTLYKMHSKRCGNADHTDPQAPQNAYNVWPYTDVTYRFLNFSPDLGEAKTRSIVEAAFKIWSDVTPLNFIEVKKATQTRVNIEILFMSGRHTGCYYDFDGPGGVLAHAFFPQDGRSHFDEDEYFTNGTYQGTNLLWVAAHEFGHALGLSHSNVKGALMFPYYSGYTPNLKLPQDDTYRIQRLYGSSTDKPRTKGPSPAPTNSPAPTDGPCIDKSHTCPTIEMKYCRDIGTGWEDWMRQNCAKKCNFCGGSSTMPPSTVVPTKAPSTQPSKAPSPVPTRGPTTDPPCEDDKDAGCSTIESKYCRDAGKSWEDWMRQNCAAKCNFCGAPSTVPPTQGASTATPTQGASTAALTQGESTTAPTQGASTAAPTQGPSTAAPTQGESTASPTKVPTPATTKTKCKDMDRGCQRFDSKYCRDTGKSWEDWMRKNCAKRCNFCSAPSTAAPCKDKDAGCHKIDLRNCRNAGQDWENWMRRYCAGRCNFCDTSSTAAPTQGASTTAPTTPVPTKKPCKDQNSGCNRLDLKNCRDTGKSWEDWMRKNCAKRCNFCGPKPTTRAPLSSAPLPDSCGKRQPGRHLGVIGGVDAKRGDWPWQILMLNQGYGGCGGALISDRWVVTAAHCVYKDTRASSYKVRVGETDQTRFEGSEVEHQVKKVIVGPTWNPTKLRDDIALFLLETPVQFNKYVQPACLPKDDAIIGSKNCYISGWGKIQHPGYGHPELQQAMMPPVDSKVCEKKNQAVGGFLAGVNITAGMVCAGEGGVNPISGCHGDSGGPYVCEENGQWYLHGAVSHGSPRCKSSETYTVFARVNYFKSWILDQMKKYI